MGQTPEDADISDLHGKLSGMGRSYVLLTTYLGVTSHMDRPRSVLRCTVGSAYCPVINHDAIQGASVEAAASRQSDNAMAGEGVGVVGMHRD